MIPRVKKDTLLKNVSRIRRILDLSWEGFCRHCYIHKNTLKMAIIRDHLSDYLYQCIMEGLERMCLDSVTWDKLDWTEWWIIDQILRTGNYYVDLYVSHGGKRL